MMRWKPILDFTITDSYDRISHAVEDAMVHALEMLCHTAPTTGAMRPKPGAKPRPRSDRSARSSAAWTTKL